MGAQVRSYMKLDAPTLDEASPQLLAPQPDTAFLPFSKVYGFRQRYIRVILNPSPNRELNIGDH